jgi:hypothetical protein
VAFPQFRLLIRESIGIPRQGNGVEMRLSGILAPQSTGGIGCFGSSHSILTSRGNATFSMVGNYAPKAPCQSRGV